MIECLDLENMCRFQQLSFSIGKSGPQQMVGWSPSGNCEDNSKVFDRRRIDVSRTMAEKITFVAERLTL